jgi:hypothetical protein
MPLEMEKKQKTIERMTVLTAKITQIETKAGHMSK